MKKFLYISLLIAVAIIIGLFIYNTKTPANKLINSIELVCDSGKIINAELYQGKNLPPPSPDMPPIPGGSAKVSLDDGREFMLHQTISADGVRYANEDESFIFWSKGNGALVLENNLEKNYKNCLLVSTQPKNSDLTKIYGDGKIGFTIRIPENYKIDAKYAYQALGPNKNIYGVKFAIPETVASGTNLADDSYISIEQIPNVKTCDAKLFLYNQNISSRDVVDGNTTYSFATSTDAGAGNRYEETIYALKGTNPCFAIRYFIHYGVIENYPPGMVKTFDKQSIFNEFDLIRKSLIIGQ